MTPIEETVQRVPGTRTATGAILQAEGAVVLAASVAIFAALDGSWLWFLLLILLPDVSMLGYLKDARVGARVYNAAHTLLLPGLIAALWLLARNPAALHLAAIWSAHIGMDRMLGYGLKDPTGFTHTHLQRV